MCWSGCKFSAQVFCLFSETRSFYTRARDCENGRVRTSVNNLFLHRSNKNDDKIVKMHFFRTLEINQKTSIIWGAFIQEKRLTLSKKSWGLEHFYLAYPHLTLPSAILVLKTRVLQPQEREDWVWISSKGSISLMEHCHYLMHPSFQVKSHSLGIAIIWPHPKLTQWGGKILPPGHTVECREKGNS